MATSITATGIVFPDSSVQTTAATAGGGTTEAIASGSLSDGSTVIVNADGTVSVISATGGPPSAGTPVVFESANTQYHSTTYDSTNNKVIIAYQDGGNSQYGTTVVGTVSGTSISFGTPVVFNSAAMLYLSIVYDSTNNKVVISYTNNGNSSFGTAIVGTVSGASISFGSPAVFASVGTAVFSSTYDATNSKIVTLYQDNNNSFYGTAVVGTVSGTSISFGTPVVFNNGGSNPTFTTYDSANNKIIVAYRDQGNSSYGTARVGTVSGTSISFGAEVVFKSASTTNGSIAYDSASTKIVIAYTGTLNYGTAIVGTVSGTSISFGTEVVFENAEIASVSTTYDPDQQKVVIAYQDVGNSSYGATIVGTVSGTSISFGTAIVFESASTSNISSVYDSTNNKTVIAYRDGDNSGFGTSVVFTTTGTTLTAENYIGISDGAYSDTATATIQIAGAVDDAQSGLTAGQAYYVQGDGTLSETPDTPSVFAGTAISATKLVVQG
jgi:hypothetical protein